MKRPLALVFYEALLPGSQLVNRLQDLNYRVLTLTDVATLESYAKLEMPLMIFAELDADRKDVREAIVAIRANPATQHIPIVAFTAGDNTAVVTSGATLVVGETAILEHLPQIIEQALQVE